MAEPEKPFVERAPRGFETTEWSVVLAAGGASTATSRAALAALCEAYWHPLYAYARRVGHSTDAARDLTQGFFATLIEKGYVAAADPGRGRFRSFLLAAFKHFLANEYDRERALKRGGGQVPVELDAEALDRQIHAALRDDLTPERVYERRWALTLLDIALARLRDELVAIGQGERFEGLKESLTGDAVQYGPVAERLGMTENAARVAVHRLRQRFRQLVRAEIARLVEDPDDVDDEIRTLFVALGR